MEIEYRGDPREERPEAVIRSFDAVEPTVHGAAPEIGIVDSYRIWYYTVPSAKWLDLGFLIRLEPGQTTPFHAHTHGEVGNVERVYRVVRGSGELRTVYADTPLDRFDVVYCPTGAAHQIRNDSTDDLWLCGWINAGADSLDYSLEAVAPRDRPGYPEAFERFNAARHARGLSLPPYIDPADQAPDEMGPEPVVKSFRDTHAITMQASTKTGGDERREWFTDLSESQHFFVADLIRLDPGEQVNFHTHQEQYEKYFEEAYWVYAGEGKLRTEYWDRSMSPLDLMYFPPGAAHQVANVGTETLWFGAMTSVGPEDPEFNLESTEQTVEDRPGYVEEYRRILAARKLNDLSLPPGVDVSIEMDT